MITQWIMVGVGIVLIAGTALYVAAEFSLVTADRATVAKQAAQGDRGARSLLIGLRSLSTQLSGAQIGITITTLALGFVMQPALADLVAGPLDWIGLGQAAAESVGALFGLAVSSGSVMAMFLGTNSPNTMDSTVATASPNSAPTDSAAA